MSVSDLQNLVDQMPEPDDRQMYTTDIDKQQIEQAIREIHQGGREFVLGLIDMLGEPGTPENAKPHYALHALANYVLVERDEAGRKQLCETLAGELGGDRPNHIQAYLCQELGWAGREEAVPALGKLLTKPALSGPASLALVAIRRGAADQFRAAWPKAKGEARRHIMDGLAALAEPESREIFLEALHDEDREVRIAAASGLAGAASADGVAPLLEFASAAEGWERIQAASACLVLAENLQAAGEQAAAKRVYEELGETASGEHEGHVREAARRGLVEVG